MKLVLALTFGFYLSSFAAGKNFDIMDGAGKLVGQGSLTESKKGTVLMLDLKDVQPGMHGMHIHEKGQCQGPKFESAGGHLNPGKKKHGHKNKEGPHMGDLGNIEVPTNGNLKTEITLAGVQIKPGAVGSLSTATGSSLVIHAKVDDDATDPSGNSGDRQYCGVLAEALVPSDSATTKK